MEQPPLFNHNVHCKIESHKPKRVVTLKCVSAYDHGEYFYKIQDPNVRPQGVDSSHHAWTNVIVRRDIIWDTGAHSIHKVGIVFSLVCTFRKLIENFDVKVDVQKWALRARENTNNGCVVPSNSCIHPLLHLATILSDHHVHSC